MTDVIPNIDQLTLRPKKLEESSTSGASNGSVFVFGESSGAASGKSAPDATKLKGAVNDAESAEKVRRNARVLTRKELELFLVLLPDKLGITPQSRHGDRLCVGLLGFPNVGKSSVINTLMCATKSTHGKLCILCVTQTMFSSVRFRQVLFVLVCPRLPVKQSTSRHLWCLTD